MASGFNKVVKKLINKGVVYIGVSAGSIIAGPTIETANWKNTDGDKNIANLDDLSAMNLVPFNVFVHYEDKYYQPIIEAIQNSKYPLKILTNEQAIVIVDGKDKFTGKGNEVKIERAAS